MRPVLTTGSLMLRRGYRKDEDRARKHLPLSPIEPHHHGRSLLNIDLHGHRRFTCTSARNGGGIFSMRAFAVLTDFRKRDADLQTRKPEDVFQVSMRFAADLNALERASSIRLILQI